jgi:hypothetical protein
MKRSPKINEQGNFKELMKINVSEEETPYGDLPDVIDMHEKLIMEGNVDDELEKAHVMYSFCVLLAEEFNFQARVEEANLKKWAGEKWRKLKSSSRRKYTDNDAKRVIESKTYYCDTKIKIAKLDKLYKQLAFGGGRAIDMGAQNLKYRVNMILKVAGDFNIREDKIDDKVKSKIKSRMKRKGD